MSRLKLFLFVTLLMTNINHLLSAPISVRDSLQRELSRSKTVADSLNIMYNIFDITPRKDQKEIGNELYEFAKANKLYDVQLDILRNLSNLYLIAPSDSMHKVLIAETELVPESDDKKMTKLFLEIALNAKQASNATEAERQYRLRELMKEYNEEPSNDLYDRIRQLFNLCIYLGTTTHGELYVDYANKLINLINRLPQEYNPLRNMYYSQMGPIYTANNQYVQAIAADKEQLKIVKELEKRYHSQGRRYRNYDANYYNVYRRMLSNYSVLSPEEIEDYNNQINAISRRNSTIRNDIMHNQRSTIYYLMATKRYKEALHLLKKQIDNPVNAQHRRQFLKLMMEAAGAINDKESLLEATMAYNKQLEEYNKLKAAEIYKELQIKFDINELRNRNVELELEMRNSELESNRKLLRVVITAGIILLVMLVIAIWLYLRARRLAKNLEKSREKLQREQENLITAQQELIEARNQAESANKMKTQFIRNMRHEIRTPLSAVIGFSQLIVDSIPEKYRGDMERYSDIIMINNEMILTLINDVLDTAGMETGTIKLDPKPTSLQQICSIAISVVEHLANPGVIMKFENEGNKDFVLNTDAARVEQVLINLLKNATKFTSRGSITLGYKVDKENKQVVFSVTDTGIGIPADKMKMIFNRFEKVNNFSQGSGLGLHICRLIANMVNGEVCIDPNYRNGARFLFIHPIV